MSDIRTLCGFIGIIFLSVACVSNKAEENVLNTTQLQQDISGLLFRVEAAESKHGDFAKYLKQSTARYSDIKELIMNKEKHFDGFEHVLCRDLEDDFEEIGTNLNKTLDDYNAKFEGNHPKIENCKNILNNISHNLNKCSETIDEECLKEIKVKLSGLDDFRKHLERIVNDTDEDFTNFKADVDDLLSKVTSLGYNSRSCLSKLYDVKDSIILNNSSVSDIMNRVRSQFVKGASDSRVLAKTLNQTFAADLDEQISIFRHEFEEYQVEEKHLNTSKCIYNEDEFEKKKQLFLKLFSETADTYISSIDNEMSTALQKIRECTPNYYQELDQLSKCSDETCLNKVKGSSQGKTNFVIANITQVSEEYKNMVSKLTSAFKKSANDNIESFTRSINEGDICSIQIESKKQISDLRNNYIYNIRQSVNRFNIFYNNNISMMTENIKARERNAIENNIDISLCVIKSNKQISNTMKKFNREMTQIESQAINYVNKARKKLNLCLDESCMNDILASYKAQNHNNATVTEDNKNLTSDYMEKIKTDLSVLLVDSLKRSAIEFNKLTTCLSTAEEIHKQGSSLNSSVDLLLDNFNEYLGSITPFIKATKDTVNANVKSQLNNAVKEIEAKKYEANNEKLDLKSCIKNDNLQDLVTTAMAIFNRDIDKEQEDVDKTIKESIGYVRNAKSFTRKHLYVLDECSTEQCMEDLAKNLEMYKNGAINAIRSIDNSVSQHISRIKDSVTKLAESHLNKITIDLDISKREVLDCLMGKINSSSAFKSTFVIILSLLLLIYKLLT